MANSDFHSEVELLLTLYKEVKGIVALAETMDPNRKTYVGPINEMRNVLDHLMRSVEHPDRLKEEMHEAREHLYRAGYDTYELLLRHMGKGIIDDLKKYDTEVINAIIPKYYSDYRPKIHSLNRVVADIRANKRIDPDLKDKTFREYIPVTEELSQIHDHIGRMIPELDAKQARVDAEKKAGSVGVAADRKGRKWARAMQIGGPILGASAAFLLMWTFGKPADGKTQDQLPGTADSSLVRDTIPPGIRP